MLKYCFNFDLKFITLLLKSLKMYRTDGVADELAQYKSNMCERFTKTEDN